MAAGASRQYTAIFAIGGKLLGSFKGAMAMAEARMQRLRVVAASVGSAFRKLTVVFGGLAGAFAGFGIVKMFQSMFEGATEYAIAVEQRLRSIQYTLLKNNVIRQKGMDFSKQQAELILAHNEELAKQGVLLDDIYDEMARGLALYGVPPKQIMHAVGAMGDMLVATRGVTANEEDAARLAKALGRAIMTGQGRALQQYGIIIDKNWKKEFPTYQSRYDNLLKIMQAFKGANKEAEKTPIGHIQKFRNELEKTRWEIGNAILPLQAKMADAWLRALPVLKPIVIKGIDTASNALTGLGNKLNEFVINYNTMQLLLAKQPVTILPDYARNQQKTNEFWIGLSAGLEALGSAWATLTALMSKQWDELVREIKDIGQKLKNFDWTFGFAKQWRDAIDQWKKYWDELNLAKLPWWMGGWMFRSGGGAGAGAGSGGAGAVAPAANAAGAFTPPPTVPTAGGGRGSAGVRQSDVDQAKDALGIPGFASGGIVRRPTLAMLGERGAEAVVPLRGMGMTMTFAPNITINGNATDSEQRAMDSRLRDLASDFIKQFQRAQNQERRLSYEGGYA